MPRIRTVKPEFFTDEDMGQLSRAARLFYIGLWNHSDDHGVVEASLVQAKIKIFPYDQDVDLVRMAELVDELEKLEKLVKYEAEGKTWWWLPNLKKHQKIDKERKSKLPLPKNVVLRRNKLQSGKNSGRPEKKALEEEGKRKGKGKGKGTPAPKGATGVRSLQNSFFDGLKEALGEEPGAFNFKTAGGIFNKLLVHYSQDEIEKRIGHWFDSTDQFIVKNAFSVTLFQTKFNILKGGPILDKVGKKPVGLGGASAKEKYEDD